MTVEIMNSAASVSSHVPFWLHAISIECICNIEHGIPAFTFLLSRELLLLINIHLQNYIKSVQSDRIK